MAFTPKGAFNAARDIATNAVERAADIVEDAGHIVKGDVSEGTSGIVQDSISIGTYAVDRVKEVFADDGEVDDRENPA
jgi:hypothetical protein